MSTRVRRMASDAAMAARFVRSLPSYLRTNLAAGEAVRIVRTRIAGREQNFLRLVRDGIYACPTSPFRGLLRAIGCEPGDLAALVAELGLESALARLEARGVFLTVDEFKGRTPIVRGSTRIETCPEAFRNPLSVPYLATSTGGSGGAPLPVQLDLACVRDRAVNMQLGLVARNGAHWRKAVWGLRGMVPLLWYSVAQPRAERWFTQVDPTSLGWQSRFAWTARLLAWESRMLGVPLPLPEYAPLDGPAPILGWLRETLGHGGIPHLWGSPSAIVRLCEAAATRGYDITGTQCTITGEPITAARLAVIARRGVRAVPDYGSVESGGTVGYGCLAPEAPDDVHVWNDVNAVIAAQGEWLPRGALLVSSLLATSPYLLLNLSMGDRARVSTRACGCAMETFGWTTHLCDIRSFEKLSAGGLTFDDGAVVGILEDVLPRRFGGGPTDYQLVEEAGECGHARLRLLVNPRIGEVDAEAVRDAFLNALGQGREVERDMAAQWRAMDTLHVAREAPRVTRMGKILHLVGVDQEEVRDGA